MRVKAWARILNYLGDIKFEDAWFQADGEKCPEDLRSAIWSARDTLEIE